MTARVPADTRLPHGFDAVIGARVRRLDGGAALLGGSPPAILRLAPAGRRLLRDGVLTVRDAPTAALARRFLDAGVAYPRPAGREHAPVTVVVPVKDNPDGVARLLTALSRTARPDEVIVVDDGSDVDRAAATAAVAAGHGARLLRHEVALGPAAARNAGLALAGTPLVAFCDSDVLPEQDGWLATLCAHFADPALALVAPRITALATSHRHWIADYERVRSSLDLGADPAPVRPGAAVSYVPSAAMVVRVAAVGAGFDPRLRVAEDVDLVFRLHALGWRLRYDPAVRVAHDHRTELRPWLVRKAFYGTGAAPLALRHPGQVPPVRLAPWTAVACLALLAQRRWSLPVAAASTAVATVRLARSLRGLHNPVRTAAGLAAQGLGGAVWQIASGLVRHWWPPVLLACLRSPRTRRAVLLAAVAEGLLDRRRHAPREPLPRYLLAHRLDDLAYGAGLWWGAVAHRTTAPLWPRIVARSGPARADGRRPLNFLTAPELSERYRLPGAEGADARGSA